MNLDVEKIKSNKVGYLLQFSVPAIISMVLTSFVTVCDGFFIGNYVGPQGLAAVNLGLPIVYFFCAVGLMVSVGGSSIAGILCGKNEKSAACKVFSQTMLTVAASGILLSLVISVFFEPMLNLLGASGKVRECFCTYFRIMLAEYPLMILTTSFGMFIRADGKPQFSMAVTFVTVLLNIILDLVFSKLGFALKGIAFASVISGLVGVSMSVLYFLKSSVQYRFVRFSFEGKTLRNSLLNGTSEFIGEMASCISMFCFNFVIMHKVGEQGVAAFTVAGYMIFVFSMIVLGFGQGMMPLVSFCYGAGENKTVIELRKLTNKFVFVVGILFSVVLFFGGSLYSSIFVQQKEICEMIEQGLKIFTLSFLLMGFNFIASMFFTACEKAFPSAVISSARGIVVNLILIFVLPSFLGITGVWLVAPVTEIITLFITTAFILRSGKEMR